MAMATSSPAPPRRRRGARAVAIVALAFVVACIAALASAKSGAFAAPASLASNAGGSADVAAADLDAPLRTVTLAGATSQVATSAASLPSTPLQRHGASTLGRVVLACGAGLATYARASLKSRRLGLSSRAAVDSEDVATLDASSDASGLAKLAGAFCNLFAVWLALAALAAVRHPASFAWIPDSAFTNLLGLLMFSVGITTTLDDFRRCFDRPGAMAINFLACYGIMPVLAYGIARLIGADGPILAGLVLVGAINGGQASNLCTLLAGGDVALSVLMTTSTTLGCIVMTPLICKMVLGTVVPVDALGIVWSTLQVVLAPIFLGVGVNTLAPRLCKALEPFTPVIGVVSTVALVGASVAKCAVHIAQAGTPLQLACLGLHLFGGVLGYFAALMSGYDERTCRTVAIETAMKSSAFGFLLASLHFGAFDVRVPCAVSVVWMAIVGSVLAVYWKGRPTS
eukprot:TRINITY_DN47603_c0_g1_i1.p1 TRINITY_DN47603_c0_g1~~TRINITY_DN47603_c0_g1_i1.p1  ORF type:complete len:485 (+),score=116.30 TRINITY_DN47603_c0_g1_i1:87-1457(+)